MALRKRNADGRWIRLPQGRWLTVETHENPELLGPLVLCPRCEKQAAGNKLAYLYGLKGYYKTRVCDPCYDIVGHTPPNLQENLAPSETLP